MAAKSNRVLFVGGKFYPIVLDVDDYFSTRESREQILEKYKKNKYFEYTREITNSHYNFFVEFVRDGKIINSGYDSARLNQE